MVTTEILADRVKILIPKDLLERLYGYQLIHQMTLGLLYDQRKYQRHNPDLGLPVWYGIALKGLEEIEEKIDRVQQQIKSYIQIQDN